MNYKGFNKDMTCRGFQFEKGKEYEEPVAKVCDYGFHSCEYPLDCFRHYAPAESVYHEVEVSGDIDKNNGDKETKVASTKIKIGAEINIAGLVKAAIEYTTKHTKKEQDSSGYCGASSATGDCGASSATGDHGASSATGDHGASSATGNCGASSATGDHGASSATGDYGASSATGTCGASSATGYRGASSATGYCGASSATGYCGASSATGDRGASSATGNCGASSATGNCGASSATGYCSASSAGHENAVAVAWGIESKAKGVLGSHLVFAMWEKVCDAPELLDQYELKGAKLVRVDGEHIKADVWYTISNGEIVEAEE